MKNLLIPVLTAILLITANEHSGYGQQIPNYPLSYPVFSPYLINPATAGSKDFFSADLISGWTGSYNSFLAGASARIKKPYSQNKSAPLLSDFTSFGAGGYVFNERDGLYNNTGAGGIFSWHLCISSDALSFISAGLTAKGIYTVYSGKPDLARSPEYTLYSDMDLGVYYYSPSFYAGISGLNLLRDYTASDTTGYSLPNLDRHLNFQVGYRQIISRLYNIVIEPSILVSENYSFSGNVKDMLSPMLKVYAGMFCAGTYIINLEKTSFFFLYKYQKFNVGAYFSLPRNKPYFIDPPLVELKIGINISAIRYGSAGYNHW